MDTFDVLIAGGGPAGSSCAWKLRDSGLKIAILDKQTFPRDKVCGGWITPEVLDALNIDPSEYARGRVLQPITGFLTSSMGETPVETHYDKAVSYGIRRCEFDHYLLQRSGACLRLGAPLTKVERCRGEWIVNGQIRARMLVGAGGTFCPVARFLGAKVNREIVVAAQEVELELDERRLATCSVRAEIPELYFCSDMKGYGWCFRKQNVLNVGLGRLDPHSLAGHVAEFLRFLKAAGRIALDVPALLGHAYLLYGMSNRQLVDDGLLLIGDAAGMAYAQSGEGIRPAIESGLLAANVIAAAEGSYSRKQLAPYGASLVQRFGKSENRWAARVGRHVPAGVISSVARTLLATHWFSRAIVLDRWFLHRNEPALNC
jgi:geranylgeranyl reductase family protein